MAEIATPHQMTFQRDGAQLFPATLGADVRQSIESTLSVLPQQQAGTRLYGVQALHPFLMSSGPIGEVAASALGKLCRPVRAILFDKTATVNWSLAWHQDRTIAVVRRLDVEGFGPWTIKNGASHVAPPFDVLAGMVTLRAHIDAVPETNAPLLIAPGSHRLGRIAEGEVAATVQRCGTVVCTANAGDVWLYSTPILHASQPARVPGRRRVLQIDYAVGKLPGGLQWLGV